MNSANHEKSGSKSEAGVDWSKKDPDAGVSYLPVYAQNIGNIPGTLKHWTGEIKKRKQEILEWKDRSLMTKATALLGTKSIHEGMDGEDIAHYNPIGPVKKLVQALKKNPMDYSTRIQLVSVIAKSKKDLPVECYRDLLLQATVAHSFGTFSIQGVQLANWIQSTYLKSLQAKCRHEKRMLKLKTEEGSSKEDLYAKQEGELKKIKFLIDQNTRVIEAYIFHTEKGVDLTKYQFNGLFSLQEDWSSFLTETSKKIQEDTKQQIFIKANATIHYMRYQALLFPYSHELADAMIKMDADHPLGYFLKGRLYMSEMIFYVSRHGVGVKAENSKKAIQQLFKQTYHQYSHAVRKAGGHYQSGSNELTMLIEYVNALRYFITTVTNVIALTLPQSWVVDNLFRAAMLLRQTGAEDKQVRELLLNLQSDLEIWEA